MRPLTLFALAAIAAAPALAQLDPPAGPVAPTFKTLDQIEPSIPVGPDTTPGDEDSVYKITARGHYHLTGNIHEPRDGFHVIEIAASGVTLDLRGYTIRTNNLPSLSSIHAVGWSNITIKNGIVSPHANGYGINLAGGKWNVVENIHANYGICGIDAGAYATVRNCRVVRSLQTGIRVDEGSLVENCIIHDSPYAGSDGIHTGASSIVRNSTVSVWADNGILAGPDTRLIDCNVRSVGVGININDGATITGCTVRGTDTYGIYALNGAHIESCRVVNAGEHGILAGHHNRIVNNAVKNSGQNDAESAAIFVFGEGNTVKDNTCTGNNTFGLRVTGTGNVLVSNHFTRFPGIMSGVQGNHFGDFLRPGEDTDVANANFRD